MHRTAAVSSLDIAAVTVRVHEARRDDKAGRIVPYCVRRHIDRRRFACDDDLARVNDNRAVLLVF